MTDPTTDKVVLMWDIDGTLLTTGRAGIGAWQEAVAEITGTSIDMSALVTAGLTDAHIAATVLEVAGVTPNGDLVAATLRAYEQRLPEALHSRVGAVLPGVADVLGDLAVRARALCLLLTGNTPAGAAAKLSHYGISPYFPHGGAFCDGPGARREIAARALARATEMVGAPPSPEHVYVIGDTPHDIDCGDSIGARTIAVASGDYSCESLSAHRPWAAVETIPEPDRFRALVGLD
jgi:phosphoglycolate phosphatase-like HAD superfamily hydrolase